ncbi:MAG: glycoside hydrolase family 88 protein [Chitinophagaceae bacterium]
MQQGNKILYIMFSMFFLTVAALHAQSLPGKKTVLEKMQLANAYFMHTWPDAGKTIITNKERPSNIWTRAVYYEGLMALYSIDRKKNYYAYAMQWGDKHQWGLNGGVTVRNADNQCCGQTYIDLYLLDKKVERMNDIKESIDAMMATDKIDDWNWIDAIQMAMPVYARLGAVYNDTNYFRRMHEMYDFSKYKQGGNGLYNPIDHKDMVKALLPLQRADGFWNVSLHDSTHFGGKELSGTALFTYGMAGA